MSGDIVQVVPEIAGTVVAIGRDENQFVRVGQRVVELDDTDARIAVARAEANLDNTTRKVRGMLATTAGLDVRIDPTSVDNHPDVLAAAEQVHAAYLQLARTKLPASVSGFVAKRMVELGQRVNPGQPLMEIVPLDELWVEASFQVRQLAAIRVGQPATLQAVSMAALSPTTGRSPDWVLGRRSAYPHRRMGQMIAARSPGDYPCVSRSIRASSPWSRCRSAFR